jgi:rhodanese-related sulfurtransferase
MTFFSSLFGKNDHKQSNVQVLSSIEFLVAVIDKAVQLVDVRTQREYDSEHIKGAMNIDWFQPFKFKMAIKNFDKQQPIYIYCRTGNRSQKAAKKLAEMGFTQIYDL